MTTDVQHAAFADLCRVVAACLAAFAFSATEAAAERLHRYTVAIDPELTTLNVRACFDGAPPPYLVAESLDAPLALMEARVESTRRQIEPSGSISLKTVPEGGCILYSANVSRPIKQHDRTGGKIQRVGTDLLTSVRLWLWRPDTLGPDEDIEITFLLPEGISVSAPWRPVADYARACRVPHRARTLGLAGVGGVRPIQGARSACRRRALAAVGAGRIAGGGCRADAGMDRRRGADGGRPLREIPAVRRRRS